MESKQVFHYFAELQANIATLQLFIWRDGPLKASDFKSNNNLILFKKSSINLQMAFSRSF
jgi:hypothetical protein